MFSILLIFSSEMKSSTSVYPMNPWSFGCALSDASCNLSELPKPLVVVFLVFSSSQIKQNGTVKCKCFFAIGKSPMSETHAGGWKTTLQYLRLVNLSVNCDPLKTNVRCLSPPGQQQQQPQILAKPLHFGGAPHIHPVKAQNREDQVDSYFNVGFAFMPTAM